MAFITFDAPAAAGEQPDGEPPPGHDLAQQVAQAVADAGFPIVEPVERHESYGWAFSSRDGDGRPVWCMLQLSDEWLVITHTPTPTFRRLLGGGSGQSEEHDRFDAAIVAALGRMPAVSGIRWHRSEADLRAKSAATPRSEAAPGNGKQGGSGATPAGNCCCAFLARLAGTPN